MLRLASTMLLVVLAASASGQQAGSVPAAVQPGARVRATTPEVGIVTGSVVAVRGDTLQLALDASPDTMNVGVSRLTMLDVSTGRHKRRWLGAGVGLLGGLGVGAAVGGATYRKTECSADAWFCDYGGRSIDVAAGAVLGGGVGAVVGAIVGAGSADDWTPVIPMRAARLELLLPRVTGRFTLGAALRL
jgi:hypothetical protein